MTTEKGSREICLSIRGSSGLRIINNDFKYQSEEEFTPDKSTSIKAMLFSPDGSHLAWVNGSALVVAQIEENGVKWRKKCDLDHGRASFLVFSPRGNVLASWETYAVRNGVSSDNVKLWNMKDGSLLHSYINRKMTGWAPQWTKDEKFAALPSNNHIHFYAQNAFKEPPSHKLTLQKFESFSFAGNDEKTGYHVLAFIRGANKNSASFGKLFKFPNFGENDAVGNKSLSFAERAEIEWNKDGTSALVLSQAEVDNSDASYYGKQQLHYMSHNGDSISVHLPKEGPIYHIAWSPTSQEFAVVYGYMPAKVTLFNRKCDKLFDFGTGARNVVHFNPQGTLLLLGGFGNLRGIIEIWDLTLKKKVSQFDAPDTTDLKWCPDGQRFVTSTCAPRLRQGNAVKIWHYSSSLLFEQFFNSPEELWEVRWRNVPEPFEPFAISKKLVSGGIKSAQPVASKVAYRPPGARRAVPGMAAAAAPSKSNFKMHDDEPAEGLKSENDGPLSKASAKNKKRRGARGKKKLEEKAAPVNGNHESNNGNTNGTNNNNNNPEKEKKISKLTDKLNQIAKLKVQQADGKKLELNQLEKIKKENEILAELSALKL